MCGAPTGLTTSTDIPPVDAVQGQPQGGSDAFLAKLDATGSSYVYFTYFGGSANDAGQDVAVDTAGNAYITGFTGSANLLVLNAFQGTYHSGLDAFVARIGLALSDNSPPTADAGPDQNNIEATSSAGASVTLQGSGSTDPDNDALTFTWTEGVVVLGTSGSIQATLALGIHTITLTVDDGRGGTDTDVVQVTVVDTTPPRSWRRHRSPCQPPNPRA